MKAKCWLFHDWKLVESWDMNEWLEGKPWSLLAGKGYECRRCGRRKIKMKSNCRCSGPHKEAANWMKEEVIR